MTSNPDHFWQARQATHCCSIACVLFVCFTQFFTHFSTQHTAGKRPAHECPLVAWRGHHLWPFLCAAYRCPMLQQVALARHFPKYARRFNVVRCAFRRTLLPIADLKAQAVLSVSTIQPSISKHFKSNLLLPVTFGWFTKPFRSWSSRYWPCCNAAFRSRSLTLTNATLHYPGVFIAACNRPNRVILFALIEQDISNDKKRPLRFSIFFFPGSLSLLAGEMFLGNGQPDLFASKATFSSFPHDKLSSTRWVPISKKCLDAEALPRIARDEDDSWCLCVCPICNPLRS